MKPLPTLITLALLTTMAHAAPDAYRKLWRDPALNQRIDDNIEKYRKGDASIEVVDAAGKPVTDAKIDLQQTNHEFLFGCNAFVLGQLGDKEKLYEEAFTKIFNFTTVPFYWEGTEPVRGEIRYSDPAPDMWRRPPAARFLPWAEKNNITLKGHPMLWHAYNPSWLPADADELRGLYQKRFREIAERFGGKINIWDVVNESLVCRKDYPLLTPDRDYVRWAFAEATPLFPENTLLMINEVTSFNFQPYETNPYVAQIKDLQSKGAKIRGIGLQYHFFRRERMDAYLASPNSNPNALLDLYEKFAEFELPLYITEITFSSAGEGGPELQAEVTSDHYRLWFSAPTMAGITWWNLGDGTAVKGENEALGGLIDEDFAPKPSYQALDQFINKTWKTQTTVKTDAKGHAQFRGFHGDYQYVAQVGGKKIEGTLSLHSKGENKHTIRLTE